MLSMINAFDMFLMTNNRAFNKSLKLNDSDVFLIMSNRLVEVVLNIVSLVLNVIFVVDSSRSLSIVNFSSSIML